MGECMGGKEFDESFAKLWPLTRVWLRTRGIRPEGQAFVIIECLNKSTKII